MIEFDIWQWEPDTTAEPEITVANEASMASLSEAPDYIVWPWADPQITRRFRFTWITQADLALAKAFWAAKGGSAAAFLLPSWEREITLAGTPTPGQYLEVEGINWLASFPIHHPDGPGRYIYCHCPENGFWASRVVGAVDYTPSTTLLELETPLPWVPVDYAITGFLYVVRFADDEAEFVQFHPEIATAEFAFVSTRQRILKEEERTPVDGIFLEASRPLALGSAEPVEPPQYDMTVAYTWGPKNWRVYQNANYEEAWAGWLGTNSVRLGKFAPGEVAPPDDGLGFASPLFTGTLATTHLSLAFDQNGFEAFSWQSGPGVASVRRLVNGVIQTFTFPGFEPILFFNGNIAIEDRLLGESELVCYYRKPGYALLFARIMRDNFNIEYVAAQIPFIPVKLLDVIFDRDARTYSVRFVDVGWRTTLATSSPYPEPPPIPPDPFVPFALDPYYTASEVALYGRYQDSIVQVILEPDRAGSEAALTGDYTLSSNPGDLDRENSGAEASMYGLYQDSIVRVITTDPAQASVAIAPASNYSLGIASGGTMTEYPSASVSIAPLSSYSTT